MIAFEVHVNGRRLSLAGVDRGVMTVVVARVDVPNKPSRLDLEVSGLREDTYFGWPGQRSLERGDEILIRVREVAVADAPAQSRRRADRPHSLRRAVRAFMVACLSRL